MSHCFVCQTIYWQKIGVQALFSQGKDKMCSACINKLERAGGCVRCSKVMSNRKGQSQPSCTDCMQWSLLSNGDPLVLNESIYCYNDFLKKILALYKYRGDVALAKIFQSEIEAIIPAHFRGYEITIIPLTEQNLVNRGFNQAEQLVTNLNWHSCLGRSISNDDKKQSKKTRAERINWLQNNPFYIKKHEKPLIKGKNYLIIDDIYTTGVTVRLAAMCLMNAGAHRVSSLTLARS